MARIRTRSRTASCVSSGTYTAVSSLARRRRARDCASRAARQHRATDRLAQAAPASQTLLVRAAERGANLGTITAALLGLLERFGATALQDAICEALERDVPHPNAVRLALERRREQR